MTSGCGSGEGEGPKGYPAEPNTSFSSATAGCIIVEMPLADSDLRSL